MKVLLLHRDRDFQLAQLVARDTADLVKDLELDTLWQGMAGDDEFLAKVAREAIFSGLQNDQDTILYRQSVLRDCLKSPATVRSLYKLAEEAIEAKKSRGYFGMLGRYPSSILHGAIDMLQMFTGLLRTLRDMAQEHAHRFDSEGFTNLFELLQGELGEDYLGRIEEHLQQLKFKHGVLLSAELDKGNQGVHYVVRKPKDRPHGWRHLFDACSPAHSFRVDERDERGAHALSDIQGRGINGVANALAQSADHILNFFQMLRTELAFYVGCLNLHEKLAALPGPVCFPQPHPVGSRRQRFGGLYDVCLALQMGQTVVGNAADAEGKSLVIITGANQGGKSSFLRGIGLAQLMMQCGMFVGAESFEAELCTDLLTHYKREEDASMLSGKFDEELARMSKIADRLAPNSLLLFNESFAATNEREGSEIAGQVVRALLEKRIKVYFVTHLHAFAQDFFDSRMPDVHFLRAERLADGTRTFRLLEGQPLETSYAEDLYRKIFDDGDDSVRAMAPNPGAEKTESRNAPGETIA